jgi:hypothetical protein
MSPRHALGIFLVGLLTISALGACLLAALSYITAGEVERLQARADAMSRTSSLVQQLATESLEFGRQNPALDALLARLNIRPAGEHPNYPMTAPSNSTTTTVKRP